MFIRRFLLKLVVDFYKNKIKMEQTNNCNNDDDELLAEEVQMYHCLYDEESKGHEKKTRKNAEELCRR